MTRDEAVTAITTLTKLSHKELEGLLSCSHEDRALLVQSYKDAGQINSGDTWAEVLKILQACTALASAVLPVLNAVQAVFGVISAIEAL